MRNSIERPFRPVLRACKTVSLKLLTVVLFGCMLGSGAVAWAQQSPEEEFHFHTDVPLGIEALTLNPSGTPFYVMALAQNSAFEGMRQVRVDEHPVLLDARGDEVKSYPQQISFRVTASAWSQKWVNVPRFSVEGEQDANDYLLGLRFRLKIFRGLNYQYVEPTSVALVGMPADVAYEERIYVMSFALPHVPIDDRIVLEVLAPSGDRVCKFHLDLK